MDGNQHSHRKSETRLGKSINKISERHKDIGRILISCPDRPGIVSAVSQLLFNYGANITNSDQHSTDPAGGTFFMRVEFHLPDLEKQGPIIEQDVQRVDHRHAIEDLHRIGRHIERVVLAKAVAWHVEDRVLVHGNKTVVFA